MKLVLLSAGALLTCPVLASAATLYSEDFQVDPTANWTINGGPSDEAADFFFDYSTVGIPSAPNAGGTTRGMKLQANLTDAVFSGMSVSPTGQNFAGDYILSFDWWANANGPFPAGGSGSTNVSSFGIGTAGTTPQWAGGVQDSLWFGATAEGGSAVDYRAYSSAAATGYTDVSGVFAAGTQATARNNSDPYYADLGNVAAPAAQLALFPQQTGNTAVGTAGMTWHEVTIAKNGDIVTWLLGNKLIATVNLSDPAVTLGGGNILFGHSDINATSSTDPNDAALLFTLIDNVRVSEVPEPASLSILALGGLALARRRRS